MTPLEIMVAAMKTVVPRSDGSQTLDEYYHEMARVTLLALAEIELPEELQMIGWWQYEEHHGEVLGIGSAFRAICRVIAAE